MVSREKIEQICSNILAAARSIRHLELRRRIENQALNLIDSFFSQRGEAARQETCEILGSFVRVAVSVGELDEDTESIILEALGEINSEVRNVAEFPNYHKKEGENPSIKSERGDLNAEARQRAIIEKIRRFTNDGRGCGLKELMEAFPDVSDRTLRYDLQKITQKGLITKVGNRGPNTVYRLAENV